MQISAFETLTGLERRLAVDIEAKEIDSKVNKRLLQLSKTLRLDGFRPGKIPNSVLNRRYKPKVRAEIVYQAVEESLKEALKEKQVKPAGYPSVKIKQDIDGQDVAFEATFEIYPEIAAIDIDKLRVTKPTAEITADDIEDVFRNVRRLQAEWVEVERGLQKDDRVVIDSTCFLAGVKVEAASAVDQGIDIGRGPLLPEFEQQLLGATPNQHVTFSLDVPESYAILEIAGKTVEYQVTVKKILEPKLPELSDELLKNFGYIPDGEDSVEKQVHSQLERSLLQAQKEIIKQQIFKQLLEQQAIDVPKALVQAEISQLQQRQKWDGKVDASEGSVYWREAEQSVKLGLIIGHYVQQNDIKYDEQKVLDIVKRIAVSSADPATAIKNIVQNEGIMQQVIASVLEEQAIEKLSELVSTVEENKSFAAIMDETRT